MGSLLSLLITFGWLCFLLWGWVGIGSITRAVAQPAGDTTGIVKVPINTERSIILWKGTEMWETGKHEGTVNLKNGYLSYENGHIVGGHFVADMNSIVITDIPKHEPVPRRRLRGHLKSDDFFYVEKYPTAEFEITQTEVLKSDSVKVWGNLSIRDVTKSISFMASRKSGGNSTVALNTTFKIDRFEYNVSYQGTYWDRITSILDNTFVDADIQLTVKLIASPAK